MAAGTALGDTCDRRTPGWTTPRCPGTIEVIATGQRDRGGQVQVLGCTTCWTTLRPDSAQLVDVPLPLGDWADAPPPPDHEPERTTAGNIRYAARARNRIRRGEHPLTGGRLHPDAVNDLDDRKSGPRCGTCVHLKDPVRYSGPSWRKCALIGGGSEATDCRAWWPACPFWEARG